MTATRLSISGVRKTPDAMGAIHDTRRKGEKEVSPELETLDQLAGGDMPLPVIRGLYPDDAHFVGGLSSLLHAGEVRLVATDGTELPRWRWREVLADPAVWDGLRVDITRAGERGSSAQTNHH